MRNVSITLLSLAVVIFDFRSGFASTDTIGNNGIRSANLFGPDATPLTGLNIAIGQVEPSRPGDPTFDTTAGLVLSTVDPEFTGYRKQSTPPQNFNATPNSMSEIGDHAEAVAGIIISKDTNVPGVAPDAKLYSVGENPSTGDPDEDAAVSAAFVISQSGKSVRAINMSFGITLSMGDSNNGNRLLTEYVDWSAQTSHDDVLYLVSGNETSPTSPVAPIPKDNFNGMTIGASTKGSDGKYDAVAAGNNYSQDADGDRTSISLIAPGQDVLAPDLSTMSMSHSALDDGTSVAYLTSPAPLLFYKTGQSEHIRCIFRIGTTLPITGIIRE